MSNFTKGEWKIDNSGYFTCISKTNDVGVERLCTFPKEQYSEANAHLIAAAPDMYTEITHLIHELNFLIEAYNKKVKDPSEFFDAESCHKAQVLLAKARGEL